MVDAIVRRWGARRLAASAAAGVAALALPAAAAAHATLTAKQPAFGARLEAAPAKLVLRFSMPVKVVADAIQVRTAGGRLVSRAPRSSGDGKTVSARLGPLPRGGYTVRWQVLSVADGHVVSGLYTFGVGIDAPPVTSAQGASPPAGVDQALRWALLLSLAALLGGLAFRLLVLPRDVPERIENRFYLLTALATLAVIDLGVASFLARAGDAFRLPFGRLLFADLSPIANGTRIGTAFIAMTLGFAVLGAALTAAWLSGRRAFLWLAFGLGLLFASGLSLSGHSASEPNSTALSVLADWLHLAAASIWIGGLLQLFVVAWGGGADLRRRAFVRFARLMSVTLPGLVAGGLYLAFQRLAAPSDLWAESYGRILLLKLAIAALAFGWGAFHHFRLRPAVARPAGAALTARARVSIAAEGAIAAAVLLVTAVLANTAPPFQ